eukprot:scaffold1269_cov400-Prasinococcus_capsulatus_cf.AAC.12
MTLTRQATPRRAPRAARGGALLRCDVMMPCAMRCDAAEAQRCALPEAVKRRRVKRGTGERGRGRAPRHAVGLRASEGTRPPPGALRSGPARALPNDTKRRAFPRPRLPRKPAKPNPTQPKPKPNQIKSNQTKPEPTSRARARSLAR